MMERLSGMDATFLYLETPAGHMHVAMVGIFDAGTMPGGYSFQRIKDTIRERLPLVPPFRRRLVRVPFDLHHPVWIEDPHFNLDYHVRRIGCPAPGGRRELAEVAGQIVSIPLDRNRPLWEMWIVEGLKQNRIGFVCKVHHAAIDGASGAEIMTEIFDLAPEGRELDLPTVEPDHVPNDLELVSYAAASKLRRAGDAVGLLGRTARSIARLVGNIRNPEIRHGAVPLTAPHTPFNQAIGPHRNVAFARVPLATVKQVKDALDIKVNDVVLAVCTGTLRRYLERHDAVPEVPLVSVVPVSVRAESEAHTGGNKVSAMFTALPVHLSDIGEQVAAIATSTEGAKEDHNALGAHLLTDWAEWAAPRTFGLAARLYSSMGLASQHRPIHNLVISNVPGPPFPLYFAGAEMVATYPMGPIMDGAGLNITVLSYRDHVDIGFLADEELVADVWDLAADVGPAFDELVTFAGLTDPTLVKRPAPVTPTSARARAETDAAPA